MDKKKAHFSKDFHVTFKEEADGYIYIRANWTTLDGDIESFVLMTIGSAMCHNDPRFFPEVKEAFSRSMRRLLAAEFGVDPDDIGFVEFEGEPEHANVAVPN